VPDPVVTTEVRGISELNSGSDRLCHNIDGAARSTFRATADQVATLIARKQPVLSGRLAASVSSTGTDKGAAVELGAGVPYAGWIEFGGTRGRAYVPDGRTVYPTAEESKTLFEQAGDKAARDQIRTMLWPKPSKL
jgi:phage gpG-like protein